MAEIRKLVWQVVWAVQPLVAAVFGWSVWRRQHQTVARTCHYHRRVRLLAPKVHL